MANNLLDLYEKSYNCGGHEDKVSSREISTKSYLANSLQLLHLGLDLFMWRSHAPLDSSQAVTKHIWGTTAGLFLASAETL